VADRINLACQRFEGRPLQGPTRPELVFPDGASCQSISNVLGDFGQVCHALNVRNLAGATGVHVFHTEICPSTSSPPRF
jgi:hypothetical protein